MSEIPSIGFRQREDYMFGRDNMIIALDGYLYRNPRMSGSGERLTSGCVYMNNMLNRLDWDQIVDGSVIRGSDGIGYEFMLRVQRLDDDGRIAGTASIVYTMDPPPHPSALRLDGYARYEYQLDRQSSRVRVANLHFGNPFIGVAPIRLTTSQPIRLGDLTGFVAGVGRLLLHDDGKYYFMIPYPTRSFPEGNVILEWMPPSPSN